MYIYSLNYICSSYQVTVAYLFRKYGINHLIHMDYFYELFMNFLKRKSFSSQISSNSFVFWRWSKVLRVWNDM